MGAQGMHSVLEVLPTQQRLRGQQRRLVCGQDRRHGVVVRWNTQALRQQQTSPKV
jgi:hypothetical protein